jgi:hypothetical protein
MASILGTLGKGVKEAVTETGKKAGKAIGATHENITLSAARKIKDATKESSNALGKALNKSSSETTSKIAFGRLSNESWFGKAADDIAFADVRKETLKNYAADLNLSKNGSKAQLIKRINGVNINGATQEINKAGEAVAEGAGEKIGKNIANKSSRKKNALIGSAVGGISGAGIGGITGMATGADKDDQNGMIVTGALAGMTGGAIVGGLFGNNITKVAGGIAKGASNEAVEGGAKGFLSNVGASVQDFADKIDDVGENVSKKLINNKGKTVRSGVFDALEKQGFSTIDAQELSHGVYGDSKVKDALSSYTKTANTLGGAAQGAIMGSVSGAVVGGVAGGIDEDDTFLGGALKGGLIGGTLGGIGGGVSGYFNNNAKLFANTTANVNSLLGKK